MINAQTRHTAAKILLELRRNSSTISAAIETAKLLQNHGRVPRDPQLIATLESYQRELGTWQSELQQELD